MTLPPVPETFHWTRETWGAALTCPLLGVAAQHLFTTRQLELPSRESWQKLAPSAGVAPDRFITLNQVHGRRVITIPRGIDGPALAALQTNRPDADGVVSAEPDIALVVRAADCVPLLMADRRTGVVAAVHAGWRGTAARVALAAIETMGREFESRPEDVIVAIGPAIGPCCYEVGTDVVDAFASAGHERYLIERWFQAPPAPRGGFRPVPSATDGPRMRLDVPGANRDQLILAGVAAHNIHLAGLCTAMHLDVLTSYRAEKERAGRIAGVIRASEAPQLTTLVSN